MSNNVPDPADGSASPQGEAPTTHLHVSRRVTRVVATSVALLTLLLFGHALLTPAPAAPSSTGAQPLTPFAAAPEIGHMAPDVPLVDLSGNHVVLSSLRGKVVVLNFWYVACEPCRFEMPLFERYYHADRDDGLVVVGINVTDDPQTIAAFLTQLGVDYPVLRDVGQRAAVIYRVTSTPTTFFIDRQGVIRGKYVGALTESSALNGYIVPLLARP